MTELWERGAEELAGMIRTGETTSAEVVSAHLSRIEAVNGDLNAIVRVMADEARAGADTADKALATGESLGPLGGVPFTIKENIDVAGVPTTFGLNALAEAVAPVDAPMVERMKAAGGIPLARTNMPDMGLRVHTDNALHGLTRNPWHPDHTAGGSSGGEGAALASGMSPIGLGNDLGGSLRSPASCCSIASIKPTLGRVPGADTYPAPDDALFSQLLSVQGVMARNVADVRLGLSIVAGAHHRDPHSVPVPLSDPAPARRKVAVMVEPAGGQTHPGVAAATRAAADALANQGCIVEEIAAPRFEEVTDLWFGLVLGGVHMALPLLAPILSPEALAFLQFAEQIRDAPTLDSNEELWMRRQSLMREWAGFFNQYDVLLTPTWTEPPFKHGLDAESAEDALAVLMQARAVMPANALGLPSAAVPAGMADGLPVGVLVNGPYWSELLCLEIAEMIEAAGLGPAMPIDPITSAT